MRADDLARALEDLRVQLNAARGSGGREKSRVEGIKNKVDSMVGTSNGQGNVQLLRGAATELSKALDQVDVAHDALKDATDAVQSYLSTHFRLSGGGGGGSAGEWFTTGPVGDTHIRASRHAQEKALWKEVPLIGATGLVAAYGVGTFVTALVGGAALAGALEAQSVPFLVAIAVSGFRQMRELKVLKDRGARQTEVNAKYKSIAKDTAVDVVGELIKPIGLAKNFVSVVDDVTTLIEKASDDS